MTKAFRAAFAAAALLLGAESAQAQYAVSAPIVSMSVPPPHGIYLPPTVRTGNPYFAGVSYYPIPTPWIGHAAPSAMIYAPARVTFGAFGRTYVRTPYYRVGF